MCVFSTRTTNAGDGEPPNHMADLEVKKIRRTALKDTHAGVFRSGNAFSSPRPTPSAAASPVATPAACPATMGMDEVPMDAHARALLQLGRKKWFVPAKAIARAAGFEGVSALAQYRKWVGKLKKNGAVPDDVEEYHIYPADVLAEFYLVGDHKVKSSTELGIDFSLAEQRAVVTILKQYQRAVLYGIGRNDAATEEEQRSWRDLCVPLCAGYGKVFYLNGSSFIGNPDAAPSRAPSRRQFTQALVTALVEMVDVGVLDLDDKSEQQTPAETAPTAAPASATAPVATPAPTPSAPEMMPRAINFKSPNKIVCMRQNRHGTAPDGNEARAFEDRTVISMIRMKQSDVSDTEAPQLLVDLLRLWGHTIEGDLPTRFCARQATPIGGMLAFSMIAQQLLDWGSVSDQQSISTHAVHGQPATVNGQQTVTAVADGASIGEDKFIAVAMQKLVDVVAENAPVGEQPKKKFVRCALPLIHLGSSTDVCKQSALLSSCDRVISCYNSICAPETGIDMSMYDIARIVGYCANDHAESCVKNEWAPGLVAVLEAANGTESEVVSVQLCLKQGVTPPLQVMKADFDSNHPRRGAFVEPDGKPAGYIHAKREHLRCMQSRERIRLSPHAQQLILEKVYTPDVLTIRRNKVEDHLMFCNRHKLAVTLDGGMSAVAAAETEDSTLNQQLLSEQATQRRTRYKLSGCVGVQAVRTVSFIVGKPKKKSETLSHGSLVRCIKESVDSTRRHPRFTRLLGSRGMTGVMENACAVLFELTDKGDWGAVGFVDAADAKSGGSNDAHQGIRNHAESDLVLAELRVWALLSFTLIKPLEQYIQSNTTQGNMVSTQNEYADVLRKLKAVRTLTVNDNDPSSRHFPELPWVDGVDALHSAALSRQVTVRTGEVARAKEAVQICCSPPGLSAERNATQLKLMPVVMAHMASGMLKKLEGLMAPKYGGLFGMSDAEVDASELHLIPSTSDAIERYFGLASWLDNKNPNLTVQNHSYRLSLKDTKVGSRLVQMYLKDDVGRDRVSRMLYRTKHSERQFAADLKAHEDKVLAERIKGYEDGRRAKHEKDENNAAELAQMREEARRWVHLELTHRSGRRTNSAHAAGRVAAPTITSLVQQTKDQTQGTENQKNEAARKMLVRWLTVFHRVHGLSAVPSLKSIFFSPVSQKLCIVSDGATGEQKSEVRLMDEVAQCSAYIDSHEIEVQPSEPEDGAAGAPAAP